MVVMEILKARCNKGLDPHLYFYRDSNENEVDIIYQSARVYRPIEIKSAIMFETEFTKGIEAFKRSVPKESAKGFVNYGGDLTPDLEKAKVLNFHQSAQPLAGIGI